MQAYSDPARERDPHALPDLEVFGPERQGECTRCTSGAMFVEDGQDCDSCIDGIVEPTGESGWLYWFCFPGCMPDSDPIGPFNSEAEALAAAREEVE